jgi:hypothetical protein
VFKSYAEVLAAIEIFGVNGLMVAAISLLLYLLGLIDDLKRLLEDEDEVNQDADVHQADATSQTAANNDTSQSDSLLVETAVNEGATGTESEETKRCPDCGDLTQPDSKYCAYCARKH